MPRINNNFNKVPLFSRVEVDGQQEVLPPGMKDLNDGVMVFIDFRRGRDAHIATASDVLHGKADEQQPTPIASFFVTMEHTTKLTRLCVEGGHVVAIPLHTSNGQYSHVNLSLLHPSADGEPFRITLDVVPNQQDTTSLEEGEILQFSAPYISKSFLTCVRTHASYVVETHNNADNIYVHGMRKVVAFIAWGLCQCPPINTGIPMVPGDLTVMECVDVINAMGLEVGVRDAPCNENRSTKTEPMKTEPMKTEAADNDDNNRGLPLHLAFSHAQEESGLMALINVTETPTASRMQSLAAGADDSGADDSDRQSVYPIGMLTAKQVSMIPCASRIISFMRNTTEWYGRELAGRMVLGAFNCFRYEVYTDNGSKHYTHFIEDMENQSMHEYAKYVTSVIRAKLASSISGGGSIGERTFRDVASSDRRIRSMEKMYGLPIVRNSTTFNSSRNIVQGSVGGNVRSISFQWNGVAVNLYSIRMGQDSRTGDPVYAFAFCKETSAKPFALAGMRYVLTP